MREPVTDTTWEAFLAAKIRECDEIQVVYASAPWWEREHMKGELARLYFEIRYAEDRVSYGTFSETFDEVPW